MRYFGQWKDDDFLYIAIEECAGNLEDFIKMMNASADSLQMTNSQDKIGINPEKRGRDPIEA